MLDIDKQTVEVTDTIPTDMKTITVNKAIGFGKVTFKIDDIKDILPWQTKYKVKSRIILNNGYTQYLEESVEEVQGMINNSQQTEIMKTQSTQSTQEYLDRLNTSPEDIVYFLKNGTGSHLFFVQNILDAKSFLEANKENYITGLDGALTNSPNYLIFISDKAKAIVTTHHDYHSRTTDDQVDCFLEEMIINRPIDREMNDALKMSSSFNCDEFKYGDDPEGTYEMVRRSLNVFNTLGKGIEISDSCDGITLYNPGIEQFEYQNKLISPFSLHGRELIKKLSRKVFFVSVYDSDNLVISQLRKNFPNAELTPLGVVENSHGWTMKKILYEDATHACVINLVDISRRHC